ncbi:MAG TPA: caspase family protein [Rhizobiales bacterium]|nr:caspase family protein [Hyphomicrobiales bacterium]
MRRLLLLVLFCLIGVLPAPAGGRVALVVGNSDYGPFGRLANPANDADAMARLLETELGFDVVVSRIDATYADLHEALTEFGRAAVNADVALFFYAGHGIELDGANYMLPVGADIRTDVDLINQGYRLDRVIELMVRAGAKIKIVLIDACRNNPLPTAATRGATSLGLKPLYATNTDTLIAFATEPGRVAFDGEGKNSPFTAGLIDYLSKPDIEIQSVLRRVRNAVYHATNQRQFPWWDDMFLSDVFLGGRSEAPARIAGQSSSEPSAGTKAPSADDIAMCERLGDGASTLMMEAYLERYPDGFCASAVRRRLAAAPSRSESDGSPAPAIIEAPAPPMPVPAPPEPSPAVAEAAAAGSYYKVSSYWNHNGSLMALSAQGDSRVFYYEKPRELIAKAGVTPGTVLFKGKLSGKTYQGQAFIFSAKCGPIAYAVSGTVSADWTRVDLHGNRPVRDANCRQTGTKPDHLVFEYRSKTL